MNAINFLIQEHNKVKTTLAEINKTAQFKTKQNMFNDLGQELIRHETMEQNLWYPHFKDNKNINDEVKHLISEEGKAAKEIKKLNSIDNEKDWLEKFTKLKTDVEHHAAEEENKLFPKVKQILSEAELEKIGQEMQQFKNKVGK